MSVLESDEARIQDLIKCHIPQRLPTNRQKNFINRPKTSNISESQQKQKFNAVVPQCKRFKMKSVQQERPKSANRGREDMGSRFPQNSSRPNRPDRDKPTPKRPSIIPRRVINDNPVQVNKVGRQIIMVPLSQRTPQKTYNSLRMSNLPDQKTITKHEELELQDNSPRAAHSYEFNEDESITSTSDKLMQLKVDWQEKMVQFEKMKSELKERQGLIMEVYASMRSIHQKMAELGQKASLPSAEDLRVMNVAKLTPEQLLALCANSRQADDTQEDHQSISKMPVALDLNKLYNMPSKLVATCEQILVMRKQVIDWFDSLKNLEKGIRMNVLTHKLQEFNAENEMLNCSLEQVKSEFYNELNGIVDILRKGANESMALQLRTEELTYELSELNSQNLDLKKQLQHADQLKSHSNKLKVEELEKELKEEKLRKIMLRDRLSRADGQIKIGNERAAQLEAALEQSRSQNRTLERTVQQLHEQNQKLQSDFDQELVKLTESIKENTVHLEEIADAREKLQNEKEELERRLNELSEHYNESLKNMKQEINMNVVKVIESDKKYQELSEEKKRLEAKVESLCAQLVESQLRCKELHNQLQEKESYYSNYNTMQDEYEKTKRELDKANMEIEDYRNRLMQQGETLKEIERSFKESLNLEENLKRDLIDREEYVSVLEKKLSLLGQQLQENESKMNSYEEQLNILKSHISKLQEDFGEFENLNELREMVNQQRAKLLEATRQNGELAEALQNKDMELERHLENLSEHEQLLEQRDGVIKMLTEKEEEQANIIKLLRNNLEIRTQTDSELTQQLAEKKTEVDTLLTNLETRKQQITEFEKVILALEEQSHKSNVQISHLEKIIITLEEQTRKDNIQKRKDEERIIALEDKIRDYEARMNNNHNVSSPTDNLDNLIQILENELGMPQPSVKEQAYVTKRKYIGDRSNYNKHDKFECHDGQTSLYHPEPAKIVMGNFVKKTYISTNEEQFKGDNLDRKKAITNMDTQNWMPPDINIYDTAAINKNFQHYKDVIPNGPPKENNLSRNLRFLVPDQARKDKKSKMFKFAGHRL